MRLGAATELAVDPPTVLVDPRAGTNVEIVLRNNAPAIQTFRLEASGDGLEFLPPKAEISIGPMSERIVGLRVFAKEGTAVARDWRLKVGGATAADLPMRVVLLPRGRTVAWSADLDGDGSPEWVLESQHARAVFSTQDGGRWTEFTWKDGGVNFLPEQGVFAGSGRVEVHETGDGLEFTGRDWKRTVKLADAELSVGQSTPLPPDSVSTESRGGIGLTIMRRSLNGAVFRMAPSN
jgi:hypothetical protein